MVIFYGNLYVLFHMVPNAFFHLMKSICILFHAETNAFSHRMTSFNRKF